MAKTIKTIKASAAAAEKYTEAGAAVKQKSSKFKEKVELPTYVPSGDAIVPWSKEYWDRLDHQVAAAQAERRKDNTTKAEPKKVNPKTQLITILGDLDEIVDSIVLAKASPKLNFTNILKDNSFITTEHVAIVRDLYTEYRQEVQDALDKVDEQLVEGYAFMNPAHKRKLIEFCDSIVNGCDEYENLNKRRKTLSRKVRVKKPVAAAKQVKSLKYLKESDAYHLVSIQPELIVGAMVLWTFNTTNKKLTRYVAADRGGFKVKGCSILNYDEKESMTKTIRKPDETLKTVINGGKIVLKKLMDSLTTKPSTTNGRINANVVIVKAEK